MSLEEFLHGGLRKIRPIGSLSVLSLPRGMWCLNRLALPPVKVALTALFWGCCAVLSHSVMSKSLQPHGLQPTRLLCPWVFPREKYWSGLPRSPTGDLPNPGIKPRSPALQADSLPESLPRIPMEREAWQAAVHGVIKESDTTD